MCYWDEWHVNVRGKIWLNIYQAAAESAVGRAAEGAAVHVDERLSWLILSGTGGEW